jgi:hypothetical protein
MAVRRESLMKKIVVLIVLTFALAGATLPAMAAEYCDINHCNQADCSNDSC